MSAIRAIIRQPVVVTSNEPGEFYRALLGGRLLRSRQNSVGARVPGLLHVSRAMTELAARDRAQLAVAAYETGRVGTDPD
jgi:hypothetical protein